jgi:hypothetical protein
MLHTLKNFGDFHQITPKNLAITTLTPKHCDLNYLGVLTRKQARPRVSFISYWFVLILLFAYS